MGLAIKFCVIILVINSWIRTLATESLWFAIIGNIISGATAPLIYNCKSKVAATWFRIEDGP